MQPWPLMGSFMRCLTKLSRGLLLWLLGWVLAWGSWARADGLPQLRIHQQGDVMLLDAHVPLAMPEETQALLLKGVPMVVVQEVKLLQSRWYWQDAVLATVRREWTLSYQALTQRWRVMLRNAQQVEQFDDVQNAWTFLTTIEQWPIGEVTQLGALRDAQAELTWTLDRRAADASVALSVGDAGAAWRLKTVGRMLIPNTAAPVRDAMQPKARGS